MQGFNNSPYSMGILSLPLTFQVLYVAVEAIHSLSPLIHFFGGPYSRRAASQLQPLSLLLPQP